MKGLTTMTDNDTITDTMALIARCNNPAHTPTTAELRRLSAIRASAGKSRPWGPSGPLLVASWRQAAPLAEPVTLSGWYPCTDGTWSFASFKSGMPRRGPAFDRAPTDAEIALWEAVDQYECNNSRVRKVKK